MGPDTVGDDSPEGATDLRHVGPRTAAVIERAPFDAGDVRNARVSHRMLVENGVDPAVAERLRREYRLLWDFYWHPGGEYLPERAANVCGATAAERRWIAASAAEWDGDLPGAGDRGEETPPEEVSVPDVTDWPDWPDTSDLDGDSGLDAELGETSSLCPRCEGDLTRFRLGEQQSLQCASCGYVGIQLAERADVWRRAVDRLIRGEID